MGGLSLLDRARAAGLTIVTDGETLSICGPRRAEPIARELLANKREVIAALTPRREPIDRLILGTRTPWGTICWSDPAEPPIEMFGPPLPM
jgi:hypothetical protein